MIVIQPITYAQNKYQQQWFHSTWFNDCIYDYNSLMCKNVSYNNYIDYIILDDDAFDILELHPNKLIRTSFKTGLTGSEVSLALASIMELYYG